VDSRPDSLAGKAKVLWEETGKCTTGVTAVWGQTSMESNTEITSGRTILQQGLAATCKDPPYKTRALKSVESEMVWRMSPYEPGDFCAIAKSHYNQGTGLWYINIDDGS